MGKASAIRSANCPKCHGHNVVRIQYGYPTPDVLEAAQRGELVIGGCVVRHDMPRQACRDCDTQYFEAATSPFSGS
jgi:hypothetical protein